jgi:hypothetical protein
MPGAFWASTPVARLKMNKINERLLFMFLFLRLENRKIFESAATGHVVSRPEDKNNLRIR